MQALRFTPRVLGYLSGRLLGGIRPDVTWRGIACLGYEDVRPPALPGSEWMRVRTRYGGICGSDVSLVRLHGSAAVTPFMSFPCTLGHENAGVVAADGPADLAGRRVFVNPLLSCAIRGFTHLCSMCAAGEVNLCRRFREGALAPGMLTGYCRDTGGSWSESFVAHRSQVVPLPEDVSDEAALFIEPFAVALHAVLRRPPPSRGLALVLGGGVLGLLTVAALRLVAPESRVVIVARHPAQQAMARELGADTVITARGSRALLEEAAAATGAEVLRPIRGPRVLHGGVPAVYECTGAPAAVDAALRVAAAAGDVVLVGLTSVPRGVDWTPVWLNELRVSGSYCYAVEDYRGERLSTPEVAVRLLAAGAVHLEPLLTHRFALAEYDKALRAVTDKRNSGVLKAAFDFAP